MSKLIYIMLIIKCIEAMENVIGDNGIMGLYIYMNIIYKKKKLSTRRRKV
jgi:hypothetical protein